MSLVSTLVVLLLCAWCAILLVYRRRLLRLWREPVLAAPVLIIESDDWGPGPASHVAALERLIALLARHRDASGQAAVMTIGAVLAIADTAAIRAGEISCYRRQRLCDSDGAAMREALLAGRARGVLALQLHGMEHYWPPSLLTVARRDAEVRDWLETAAGSDTERLPSALQSRWTDVTTLPSRPLPESEIRAAVAEEVACFETSFGARPLVAVPPTFVWTEQVERAWAEAGVRVSLFVDPEPAQLDAARAIGAPVVELHTGHYADAQTRETRAEALARIERAVDHGLSLGLQVNAGHGLDYDNVKPIAAIPGITELNIGHAIIARALFSGLDRAVRDMRAQIAVGSRR